MKEFLNYTIFQLGDTDLKVAALFKLIVFITIVLSLLALFKKLVYRAKKIDTAKKYAVYSLVKYFILVFAIVTGLQIIGFNLSVLLASSAALLVGVGLGLQNLFSDFVSGFILLVDSAVKVGDVLDVDGLVCKVQDINLRTTTVLTRDDKYIILPNTMLTSKPLINWTHNYITSRFEVNVGVDYASDITVVMNILKEVATQQDGVLKSPVPFVRFTDYADSSLNFAVYFWVEEVFRVDNIKSDIRIKVFQEFKSNGVQIPFPQRVVHIKNQTDE